MARTWYNRISMWYNCVPLWFNRISRWNRAFRCGSKLFGAVLLNSVMVSLEKEKFGLETLHFYNSSILPFFKFFEILSWCKSGVFFKNAVKIREIVKTTFVTYLRHRHFSVD